jgi:hypothetical protein
MKISVTSEYVGMPDYWSGNGRRWDDNAGCLFAFYNDETTLRCIIDQWVDDFWGGGDCDSFPEEVTSDDIRAAIMDSLTDEGRADYQADALCGPASDYEVEWEACESVDDVEIGDDVKIDNIDDDEVIGEVTKVTETSIFVEYNDKLYRRDPEDVYKRVDDNDCCDSPMWVVLVEIETCEDCGECVNDDDECPKCDSWDLCHNDDGTWVWVCCSEGAEEEGPYDSEDEALENDPRIV